MGSIPSFIAVVGLPGSGKHSYAKQLAASESVILIDVSSRQKEIQDMYGMKNDKALIKINKEVRSLLQEGKSVIYVSENTKSKKRKAILTWLEKIECKKKCVVMATPFDECCRNNAESEAPLSFEDMRRVYEGWNPPYWYEGWDDIELFYKGAELKCIEDWLEEHKSFSQDNSHHSLSLGEHCCRVGTSLKYDRNLWCAGLLHDLGKVYTKSFINVKGEITSDAHYYNHDNVGSYECMFFKYPEGVDVLKVAILISLHMVPYNWAGCYDWHSRKEKCKELWGKELFECVMCLHGADKRAK